MKTARLPPAEENKFADLQKREKGEKSELWFQGQWGREGRRREVKKGKKGAAPATPRTLLKKTVLALTGRKREQEPVWKKKKKKGFSSVSAKGRERKGERIVCVGLVLLTGKKKEEAKPGHFFGKKEGRQFGG